MGSAAGACGVKQREPKSIGSFGCGKSQAAGFGTTSAMIPMLSVPTDDANYRGITSAVPLREGLGFSENIMAHVTPAVNKRNKIPPEFGSPVS